MPALLPGLVALLLLGAASPEQDCAALARLSIPNVTIETAQPVSGTFAAPDGGRIETVAICRVRGIARPSPASHVTFELWMPQAGWNGRYYQLGNGGFAGNIHHPSLAAEAARGNAAAVTDTGHSADQYDARWAAGQPERVVDYGHRSIKATSDAAAALIAAYYGRPARRRYFAGCSNGGRQALMAAQRYPEDWDGIIAGAPANLWTEQLTSFAALQHRLQTVPGAWIPPAKLPAIQRAALASCPARSLVEGVALDPRRCRLNPARLRCRGPERDTCLTSAQVGSLRRIQAAGFEPTSADGPDGWSRWIVNPDPAARSQLSFATQAFRYLLGDDPAWEVRDFTPRHGIGSTSRDMLDADAVDLGRFRARGGRIISYFGWADPLISPRAGLAYYRRVAQRMGGLARTRDFYRLFMVPGMGHCQGGVAPDSFGQSIPAPALRPDPLHDIRLALERWVEDDSAPDALVAARYTGDGPTRTVSSTRTLHPVSGMR